MNFGSLFLAVAFAGAGLPLASLRLVAQGPPTRGLRGEWTLEQVMATATAQHPLIEAARARVSASQGSRRTAGAIPNPIATYQVENAAFPGGRTPVGLDSETSAFFTIPIEPLYQRWPLVQRAEEEIRVAEAALTATRRRVALDAARAFHCVALAQVSVAAARETFVALERLARFNESRVQEGVTAEVDLMRVQVELERAGTQVTLDEVELARARAELRPFLGDLGDGETLDSLRVTVPEGGSVEAALPPLDEVLSRARQRRPELLAARARVAAARAEATYQQTLTVRQVGASFGTKRINGQNSMIVGFSLPLPLFDRNRGEVQRAAGERRATEQELDWAERTISAEVQAAYQGAQRLASQVARLRDASFMDRAEEARGITLSAYEEGAASLLQVLDASRTLGETRITYYRVLFTHKQTLLDLAVAAGGEPTMGPGVLESALPTAVSNLRGGNR